ncbi:MAG: hypothetical protein K6A65_06515 [Succinivibrionaceae bacterium]|nr:hypothetical protein [Succinivibrionaceae bacterium]
MSDQPIEQQGERGPQPAADQGIPGGDVSYTAYSVCTVTLPSADPEDLNTLLARKIDPNSLAYRNTAVILNIAGLPHPEEVDYESMCIICREHRLIPAGVSGAVTEQQVERLSERGIPVVNSNRYAKAREMNLEPRVITQQVRVEVPVEVHVPVTRTEPVQVVTRNIRSGETVHAPNNSVVIFGSIGDGASVVASHHIIVIGDVKGAQLHAGTPRDQSDPGMASAFIYVTGAFEPQLVSIAGNYQTAEGMDEDLFLRAHRDERMALMVSLDKTKLRYTDPKDFKYNPPSKG